MVEIVSQEHRELASRIRDVMSVYEKNADLVAIGAYKPGTNRKLDYALAKIDAINDFLKQGINESFGAEKSLKLMQEVLK